MKLGTRQDIEAPLDFVWQQLTDFEQFERMALRRGAEVERVDQLKRPGPGMGWRLRFAYRGKPRRMLVRIAELTENSVIDCGLDSASVEGAARIELMALAPRRTRISLVADLRPKTLAARLVIQSLRLAKGRTQRKLDTALGRLVALVEERWRAGS
ncbi:SRPBCC family protein [Pseudogemmobacter humi]|uniref:Polyketide cyclase / dehydrase and lipid transport n=1 Tax=Pseudogemmobacter humi TaxID=2483812 RepID=A0A3P5X1U3_9RHOB|nr:SRPBCC family protein [Pseudogemmobacter humi]VDC25191.1 hypothetical protein XINFAN_01429 [Pseudogemmobacter humi]